MAVRRERHAMLLAKAGQQVRPSPADVKRPSLINNANAEGRRALSTASR
jgi:hypothetical protein